LDSLGLCRSRNVVSSFSPCCVYVNRNVIHFMITQVALHGSYVDQERRLCLLLQYCSGGNLQQLINARKNVNPHNACRHTYTYIALPLLHPASALSQTGQGAFPATRIWQLMGDLVSALTGPYQWQAGSFVLPLSLSLSLSLALALSCSPLLSLVLSCSLLLSLSLSALFWSSMYHCSSGVDLHQRS
jgi:hypothetical protein